jgi:fumarate reductase subunit D
MIDDDGKHWLYRRENRPKLWIILVVILLLALVPEFFVHHHAHFPDQDVHVDTSFGFFAWYGFLTCTAMVVGAKVLGIFLKRKETYYDD